MVKRANLHLREYKLKQIIVFILAVCFLLLAYLFENTSFLLGSVPAALLLIVFYLADHLFNIRFKLRYYLFMAIIAISGFMLSPLFFIWPNYDKIQHFVQPIFICSIIFYMLSKLNLKLKWKIIFAFLITFAILGLFEIGEFVLDHLFNTRLQGVYLRDYSGFEKFNLIMDPLDDTMIDLVLGLIGAGIYSILMILWIKYIRNNVRI